MATATPWQYLIASGSNVRHPRHGDPRSVLTAALAALAAEGVRILAAAPVIQTAPLGPSLRRYANSAALVSTMRDPPELLALLKRIEVGFGRRPSGQRWRARVLDLDIALWSGGMFASDDLIIPHPRLREREFVLRPAMQVAPGWRDPVTGLTLRQLHARLTRPHALP